MTKEYFKALEKIFEAEITGSLPFQSNAKIYKELEEWGYVEYAVDRKHFNDGLPPMDIGGWYLTHKGRYAYCSNC